MEPTGTTESTFTGAVVRERAPLPMAGSLRVKAREAAGLAMKLRERHSLPRVM